MNALKNRTVAVAVVLLTCLTMFAGVETVTDDSDADTGPLQIVAAQWKYYTYAELGLNAEQASILRNNSGYGTLSDNAGTVSAYFFENGASIKVLHSTIHGSYTLTWVYGSDKTPLCTIPVTVVNDHDGTSVSSPRYDYLEMPALVSPDGLDKTVYIERNSYVLIYCPSTSSPVTLPDNCGLRVSTTTGLLAMRTVTGDITSDCTVTIASKYVYRFVVTDPHYDVWSYNSEYSCSYTPLDGTETEQSVSRIKNMEVPAILDVDIAVNEPFSTPTVSDAYSLEGLTIVPLHVKTHSFVYSGSPGEIYHVTGHFRTGQSAYLNPPNSSGYATVVITAYEPPTATYTLTYDANGGSGSMDNTVVSVIGGSGSVSVALAANGFTKNGYSFVGWKVGNQILQPGQTVTVSKDGTVNAVAQWSQNTLNVSAGDISAVSNLSYGNQISAFASNGATLSYAVKSCTGGTASVNTGGTVTYKAPTVNATASYTVTVTVTATFADSSTISKDVSFSVTVDPVLSFTNAATGGTLSVKGA